LHLTTFIKTNDDDDLQSAPLHQCGITAVINLCLFSCLIHMHGSCSICWF